jgi:hypothetical protein
VALAAAVAYLACVWLDAVGTAAPAAVLPPPLRFLVQVAQLFPRAAVDAIEWRAKGYRCERRRFEELDLVPYFPIHAGGCSSVCARPSPSREPRSRATVAFPSTRFRSRRRGNIGM